MSSHSRKAGTHQAPPQPHVAVTKQQEGTVTLLLLLAMRISQPSPCMATDSCSKTARQLCECLVQLLQQRAEHHTNSLRHTHTQAHTLRYTHSVTAVPDAVWCEVIGQVQGVLLQPPSCARCARPVLPHALWQSAWRRPSCQVCEGRHHQLPGACRDTASAPPQVRD